MSKNIRTEAKEVAIRLILDDEGQWPMPIERYCEQLDMYHRILEVRGNDYTDLEIIREDKPAFAHLAFSTIMGAVRAAAQELGRYSNDQVLAPIDEGAQ